MDAQADQHSVTLIHKEAEQGNTLLTKTYSAQNLKPLEIALKF